VLRNFNSEAEVHQIKTRISITAQHSVP